MNVKPVKTAEGCRLRDPKTKAILPSVTDTEAKPFQADLDDPHWYRAEERGDILVIDTVAAPAIAADATPAAGTPTGKITTTSAAAPAASPISTAAASAAASADTAAAGKTA